MASQHRRAVGIFPDRPKTASALQMLSDSGFSMGHVSVIARDPDRQNQIAGVRVQDEVTNQADTGSKVGAVTGGVLGGVTGLLVGLGTLTIPGIGPALLAGEVATVLTMLVGGAAGVAAGGLVGALIGMGIPEHRAKHYRDRVAQGDYLVMLKDTEPEIARAERTLKQAGIEDWGVYQASGNAPSLGAGRLTNGITEVGDTDPHAYDGNGVSTAPAPDGQRQSDTHDTGTVAPDRGNPYNRVDHPMDQGYPPRDHPSDQDRQVGRPRDSNPVDP